MEDCFVLYGTGFVRHGLTERPETKQQVFSSFDRSGRSHLLELPGLGTLFIGSEMLFGLLHGRRPGPESRSITSVCPANSAAVHRETRRHCELATGPRPPTPSSLTGRGQLTYGTGARHHASFEFLIDQSRSPWPVGSDPSDSDPNGPATGEQNGRAAKRHRF